MSGPQVNFDDVGVTLGGRQILSNVNAMAPAESATVLIGPNGAGKTTLLHCLLKDIPFCGQITFTNKGKLVSPRIAFVPQTLLVDSQLPLRVYEFLNLGRKWPIWMGVSHSEREKARMLLDLVDSASLAERKLGDLSGGELRRVLLAVALGKNPDLLVLDEAEAGVDWKGERLFWQLLTRARQKSGFTLIMVSHNLPLCAHYANHVICIRQTVLAQGAPVQTLDARTLLKLFGAPIHLYPAQCGENWPVCADCGALNGEGRHQELPMSKNDGETSHA